MMKINQKKEKLSVERRKKNEGRYIKKKKQRTKSCNKREIRTE